MNKFCLTQSLTTSVFGFFMLLCFSSVLSAQNAVNPGFEDGLDPWFPIGTTEYQIVDSGYESDNACLVSNRTFFWNGIRQSMLGQFQRDQDYYVRVWVKTSGTPSGKIALAMTQTDDRGEVTIPLGDVLAVENEWRLLEGGFRYQENGSVTQLEIGIAGLYDDESNHDFLVDGIQIDQNDWQTEADARIELYRKRDVEFRFVDPDGNAADNLEIQVQQIGHRFGLGSTLNDSVGHVPQYRDFFESNFERATIEWFSQWKPVERERGTEDYTNADIAVDFAAQNGIPIRGHAIVWGDPNFLPVWADSLSDEQLQAEVDERIENVVSRYRNRLASWDVSNEMLNHSFFNDRLGDQASADIFIKARQTDPNVPLCVNEYGLHSSVRKSRKLRQLVLDLRSRGAEVDGIGLQSHFFNGNTSAKGIELALAEIADLDTEIWFSEFDVVNPDPNERAKALEDFYRYAFSRPETNGVIMWGFWEGSHWLGRDASLVDLDWSVNAAGQRYLDLVNEWTTSETGSVSGENNSMNLRAFHGRYLITATDPETGITNWHLAEVVPPTEQNADQPGDQSGDENDPNPGPMTQAIEIVVGPSANTLTVYGTPADDQFEYDFEVPNVVKINGTPQFIPQIEDVASVQVQGLGGDDHLLIDSFETRTRYRIRETETSIIGSTFKFNYANVETVEIVAHGVRDQVNFYDTPGDDSFVSLPDVSTMTTPDTVFIARNFFHIVARAPEGGTDSAELYDSQAVDYCYSDLAHVRIRDDGSVRRAESFETTRMYSLSNEDRISYDIPAAVDSISMGDGNLNAVVSERSFEFDSFRFSTVSFASENMNDVGMTGGDGNDRLVIRSELIKLYGPGYSFNVTGVRSTVASDFETGADLLVLNDSPGDDTLTVNADGLILVSENQRVESTPFAMMRAVGRSGGANSATIDDAPAGFRLFGNWDQDQ